MKQFFADFGFRNLAKLYLTSFYGGFRRRHAFDGIRAYCHFVGHPRSGHSLIGSLLDAHPEVIIAHELDVLKYVRARFSRRQIYYLLLENSRRSAAMGRKSGRFSYPVPGQWQGCFRTLRVIGDKKAASTTSRLRSKPWLLDRLREMASVDLRSIQVIRNPYDTISTIFARGKLSGKTLEDGIETYFRLCDGVSDIRRSLVSREFFELRHEHFIEDPQGILSRLCAFLGVDSPSDYLSACSAIVHPSPHKSRHDVQWDSRLIATVQDRAERYDFLAHYAFAD